MIDRSTIKTQILEEFKKEKWRPSYIRGVLRGIPDPFEYRKPDNKEALEVMFFCARIYKTSIKDMVAKNKTKKNLEARQLAQYYLYSKNFHESDISRWTGRDRVTVYHSHKKIVGELEVNYPTTVKVVNKLKSLI